jgi:hypothetical protein
VNPAILLLATLVCAAHPPPAPDQPSCDPVLGPRLKAGCWGPVFLRLSNSSARQLRPVVTQYCAEAGQSFDAGRDLAAASQGEFVLLVRPSRADAVLSAEMGEARTSFPDRVAGEGVPLVINVSPNPGPRLPLPVDLQGHVVPGRLPAVAAAYEGVDLLVIGHLPEGSLAPAQARALGEWFRAGGRVAVTSETALAVAAPILMPGAGTGPTKLPATRADWMLLLGSGGPRVRWEGERPVLAEFSLGFGRGLLVLPQADGSMPEWSTAAADTWSGHRARIAPLTRGRLYVAADGMTEFPPLRRSMPQAGAALRWSLAALLVMVAAAVMFGRREVRWRLPVAVAAGALASLALVWALARPVPVMTLSVRMDEFSPDGQGVRSREYLYLEKTGMGGEVAVLADAGVLPSPVLYRAEEAAELAFAAYGLGEAGVSRVCLRQVEFAGPSLFVGAGPLPGAPALSAPPAGATSVCSIEGLDRVQAAAAISDCMSDRSGRNRAQAEFLAECLLPEIMSQRAALGAGPLTVCRLPETPGTEVMTTRQGAPVARLGRLGIFYGADR